MLVKDSQWLEKAAAQAQLESYRAQILAWAQLEAENCKYLLDEKTDPTFIPRRLGRPMHHEKLEGKIKKLVPGMKFIWGPLSDVIGTKKMVLYGPQGEVRWECVYNTGMMPERSILARKTRDVLDTNLKTWSRKDLPKYEFVPGEGYRWDPDAPPPGFKRVEEPHREVRRGWRTILLRLIVESIVPLTAVERVFGSDSTPEWHGHTRGQVTRPW